jgi:ABC-type lipoprotein release transport system permease subunit
VVAALGFAVSFCVLGALLPARRAARMEPARVLSGS